MNARTHTRTHTHRIAHARTRARAYTHSHTHTHTHTPMWLPMWLPMFGILNVRTYVDYTRGLYGLHKSLHRMFTLGEESLAAPGIRTRVSIEPSFSGARSASLYPRSLCMGCVYANLVSLPLTCAI